MTITFGFSGVAFTLAGVALIIYAAGILLRYAPNAIGAVVDGIGALVELRVRSRTPALVRSTPSVLDRRARLRREDDAGAAEVLADEELAPTGVAPAPATSLAGDVRLTGPRDIRWEESRHRVVEEDVPPSLETEAVVMSNYYQADREEWNDAPLVVAQPIARNSKLRQPPPGPPLMDER